jgi:uncharacterized protein (DUF362 family)
MSKGIDRRDFLVKGAIAGAGLVGAGWLASCTRAITPPASASAAASTAAVPVAAAGQAALAQPATGAKSRVALYTNPNLMDTPTSPNRDKVLAMLDKGVMAVFGTDTPEKAWRMVATPQDVVALKVNTIHSSLSTNPVVAYAICSRLMGVGVPAQNLIIFDRTTHELQGAGYEIVKDGTTKPYCYGTDGDYSAAYEHGAFTGSISNILVQKATVLINVPVLKDWGGVQVTLSLKNHFGTINNPGQQHHDFANTIPAISDTDPIKTKTRLIVLDASRGCWQGGPGPGPGGMWTFNGLLVSRDPVALDFVGNGIISKKRQEMGAPPLNCPGGISRYLPVAAALGLGKATDAEIDLTTEQLT